MIIHLGVLGPHGTMPDVPSHIPRLTDGAATAGVITEMDARINNVVAMDFIWCLPGLNINQLP